MRDDGVDVCTYMCMCVWKVRVEFQIASAQLQASNPLYV